MSDFELLILKLSMKTIFYFKAIQSRNQQNTKNSKFKILIRRYQNESIDNFNDISLLSICIISITRLNREENIVSSLLEYRFEVIEQCHFKSSVRQVLAFPRRAFTLRAGMIIRRTRRACTTPFFHVIFSKLTQGPPRELASSPFYLFRSFTLVLLSAEKHAIPYRLPNRLHSKGPDFPLFASIRPGRRAENFLNSFKLSSSFPSWKYRR